MKNIKLIIGNRNYSSWSLRAWFFLKAFGVDFEEIRLPLYTDMFSNQISQYSPTARVPALCHGNVQVWDSLAICDYVSEVLLNRNGWPEKPQYMAKARSISAEMHSGFTGIRNQLPMNCRALKKDFDISTQTTFEIKRVQEIWDECISASGGPWLFGSYSVADAMYAPVVSRFKTYQIELFGKCKAYSDFVLGNKHILEWYAESELEEEVLALSEVGQNA